MGAVAQGPTVNPADSGSTGDDSGSLWDSVKSDAYNLAVGASAPFNNGSGNIGIGNSGNGNTGFFNSGNDNSGVGNTGDGNNGLGNYGTADTGAFNYGSGDNGVLNSGSYDSGVANVGNNDSGLVNVGSNDSGNLTLGDNNSGNVDIGNGNTGTGDFGDYNSGTLDVGNGNTGTADLGYNNSGTADIGANNSGNGDLGVSNSGNADIGYANSGNGDVGAGNTTTLDGVPDAIGQYGNYLSSTNSSTGVGTTLPNGTYQGPDGTTIDPNSGLITTPDGKMSYPGEPARVGFGGTVNVGGGSANFSLLFPVPGQGAQGGIIDTFGVSGTAGTPSPALGANLHVDATNDKTADDLSASAHGGYLDVGPTESQLAFNNNGQYYATFGVGPSLGAGKGGDIGGGYVESYTTHAGNLGDDLSNAGQALNNRRADPGNVYGNGDTYEPADSYQPGGN